MSIEYWECVLGVGSKAVRDMYDEKFGHQAGTTRDYSWYNLNLLNAENNRCTIFIDITEEPDKKLPDEVRYLDMPDEKGKALYKTVRKQPLSIEDYRTILKLTSVIVNDIPHSEIKKQTDRLYHIYDIASRSFKKSSFMHGMDKAPCYLANAIYWDYVSFVLIGAEMTIEPGGARTSRYIYL